nr:probable LRR receptor-like serine/threonine-protein kinase At3g47570 [Aegilops tauschii subsp. strangulata]
MKSFSYADLAKATNGFSPDNLVGSGAYGSVYKGVLECETNGMIAVKVFNLDQLGAPKSFVAECEAFRNTRHHNLVRVISACSTWDNKGNDFKALIIEYMANGTLESWIYSETRRPLSLGSRLTIAVDIAAALDYLHDSCVPPIVHCDLKPSNVLLDDAMGARLSDFGLAKFLQSHNSSNTITCTSLAGPRGSIGYIAPEYGIGNMISTAGDVYSYGIVILEMLTGKWPTDVLFKNGLSLQKFVGNAFPEKICEILDPNIIGDEVVDHGNHAMGHRNIFISLACSEFLRAMMLDLANGNMLPFQEPGAKIRGYPIHSERKRNTGAAEQCGQGARPGAPQRNGGGSSSRGRRSEWEGTHACSHRRGGRGAMGGAVARRPSRAAAEVAGRAAAWRPCSWAAGADWAGNARSG